MKISISSLKWVWKLSVICWAVSAVGDWLVTVSALSSADFTVQVYFTSFMLDVRTFLLIPLSVLGFFAWLWAGRHAVQPPYRPEFPQRPGLERPSHV